MLRTSVLCVLLAPASAGLSAFFELLTSDIKASMRPLGPITGTTTYSSISVLTAVAVCDWSRGGVMKTGGAVCGSACDALGSGYSSSVGYSPSDHIQMLGLKKGDVTSLAFRGTFVWDVVNNRRNVQFALHPTSLCGNCAVHRGFWRNFVALKSLMMQVITGLGNSKTAIYGHSMGGAMAQLAALYAAVVSQTVSGLYILGAPRLGNRALTTVLESFTLFSFNVITDPVPHQTPRMFGYRSVAPLYAIFIDPIYWASLSAGDDVVGDDFIYYKKFEGHDADYRWSGASPYLLAASHLDYFIGLEPEYMITCGGLSDRFIKNNNAMSLFD